MSTTWTVHLSCDVCGKRAPDIEVEHANAYRLPEGWASGPIVDYGVVCSRECARQRIWADVLEDVERLFIPNVDVRST